LKNLSYSLKKIEHLALREKRFEELPQLVKQTQIQIKKITQKAIEAKIN
jgi:hypothetical protein